MTRFFVPLAVFAVLAACSNTPPPAMIAADQRMTACLSERGITDGFALETTISGETVTQVLLAGNGISQAQADQVNACARG